MEKESGGIALGKAALFDCAKEMCNISREIDLV